MRERFSSLLDWVSIWRVDFFEISALIPGRVESLAASTNQGDTVAKLSLRRCAGQQPAASEGALLLVPVAHGSLGVHVEAVWQFAQFDVQFLARRAVAAVVGPTAAVATVALEVQLRGAVELASFPQKSGTPLVVHGGAEQRHACFSDQRHVVSSHFGRLA